jgi:hypothetical protein
MKDQRRTALQAAVEVARRLGIPVEDPGVLRESSSVIVALAPAGPVARVAGLTAAVRDNRAHRTREVEVARFLTDVGRLRSDIATQLGPRPVVAPFEPAGPHEYAGHLVTLWERAPSGLEEHPEAIGSSLRWCHEALRSYPSELPSLSTLFDEAVRVLDHGALDVSDKRLVHDGLAAAAKQIERYASQPIHGDAGLGNVLPGPRWNDWEDACLGPIEWDLACLVTTARVTGERREVAEGALRAYGAEPPEAFVKARGLQLVAWSAFAGGARLQRRLDWLRSQLG